MMKRSSNIELLRVFSIFLIIIFHYVYKGGFAFENGITVNKFIVKTFWMFGELGVNLFILITGYFMVDGKFKIKKLILLLAQVLFYYLLTMQLSIRLGIQTVSGWRNILLSLFPVTLSRYWFITAYIIIYILSPYFNILAHTMAKKTYKKFLMTLLLLYSIIPTIFGVFYNTTEMFLYYNRLIWLTIMYFVGAYIKMYSLSVIRTSKSAAVMSIGSFIVLIISILLIEKFAAFFAMLGLTESAYFWPPNTVPMVLLSIGIFGLFLHMKLSFHPFINCIASTTLGIYLLHDSILARWLWGEVFQNASHQNSPYLILHILVAGGTIFLVGIVVDLFRQLLERYTVRKILDSKMFEYICASVEKIGDKIL